MSVSISVGAVPAAFEGTALYADGRRGGVLVVDLRIDEAQETLVLSGVSDGWPLDGLRRLRDQAGDDTLVLARDDCDPARLYVSDPETRRLLAARAERLDRRIPGTGRVRIAAWALAAVACVALIVLVLVPRLADGLARVLPPQGEVALGETTLIQIRRALGDGMEPMAICDAGDGPAAIDALVARLTNGIRLPHTPRITVLRGNMVNAFALPGGQVVVFSGLVAAAEDADMLGAVVAHELGHVEARDPTRLALRSAGSLGVLGLLFGDFAGGAAALVLVDQIVSARHGREAEIAADATARDLMARAGRDPAALGRFFEVLREEGGELPAFARHILPHPDLVSRIEAAGPPTPPDGRPLLDSTQWQALAGICGARGLVDATDTD